MTPSRSGRTLNVAAPVARRWRSFDRYLSGRCPFIWRTRLLLWATAGATTTALAATYAATVALNTQTVPELSSVLALSDWLAILTAGAVLVLVVDLSRRIGLVTSWAQAGRVFLCTAAAALAIVFPQYAFGRITLTRIAALESDKALATVIAFHAPQRFWRCLGVAHLRYEVEAHGDRIRADLMRYGLRTNLEPTYEPSCANTPSNPAYETISLMATVASSPRSLADTDVTSIELFQKRVTCIGAAKRYISNAPGASAFPMYHLWSVLALSMAAGGVVALAGMTLLARFRALAFARRGLHLRAIRRSAGVARVDHYVAARWPLVWSSRVLASPALFVIPVMAVYFVTLVESSASGGDGAVAGNVLAGAVLAGAVLAGAVLAAVRKQSIMRFLPSRLSDEVGTLISHAILFVAVVVAWVHVQRMTGIVDRPTFKSDSLFGVTALGLFDKRSVAYTLWGACLTAALLQAARAGSVFVMLSGAVVAGALGTATVWLAMFAEIMRKEDYNIYAGLGLAIAVISGLTFLAVRRSARPFVQRVAIAALLPMASLFALATTIVTLMPGPSDVTAPKLVMSVLATLATTSVVLRLTEHTRRTLAYTGK